MYLHSCQCTKRNKGYPWHIVRKSVCALQYLKETELEVSPQSKLRQKFSDFFPSATFKSLVCYFSCGVYCLFHTLPFSPSSLSIAFLFIFWSSFSAASLSSFHFPLPQIPSHLSEYSCLFGFLSFL